MKLVIVTTRQTFFGESKRSLKMCSDGHKRFDRNNSVEKNETGKHCWKQNATLVGIRRNLLIKKAG